MDFWSPSFEYEKRGDGTILMRQVGDLPPHEPILAAYLDHWAEATPDQTWLARRGADGAWNTVSYSEARQKAHAIGAALIEMGLAPEKPLLILSENSIEHGLMGLACLYVGIPYAPISPAYSLVSKDHGKLRDIAALLQPGAIFADDGETFSEALSAIASPETIVINQRNMRDHARRFDDLLAHDPEPAFAARNAVRPETVVKYLFTSGSTGSPKAVINTNGMITANQAMVRDCYRFLEHEPPLVLDWAPWNHTAAGNKVSYMVLTNGGTYYIDDGKPSPTGMAETLRNLHEIACTWYFNVPAGYDRLVAELEADEALASTFFSRLRMIFYAGAGMAQHTWDRLAAVGRKVTGRDVLISTSLGATETAPFGLAWTEVENKAGNVGVPARGLTLKLVETGGKLELRLKGPSITPGYYRDAENTAAAFDEEGFYKMGDALRPVDAHDFSRGFLFDGRLAENFKLSTGTWVAVGAVRSGLVDAMGGLIRDAVIVGENQSELGALLWLSESAEAMDADTRRQILEDKLLRHTKAATGSATRISRAGILGAAPSFDRGELTEKGSLNQRALRANNAAAIEALYQDGDDVIRV
jgi:feruloyl-CoA synthase